MHHALSVPGSLPSQGSRGDGLREGVDLRPSCRSWFSSVDWLVCLQCGSWSSPVAAKRVCKASGCWPKPGEALANRTGHPFDPETLVPSGHKDQLNDSKVLNFGPVGACRLADLLQPESHVVLGPVNHNQLLDHSTKESLVNPAKMGWQALNRLGAHMH